MYTAVYSCIQLYQLYGGKPSPYQKRLAGSSPLGYPALGYPLAPPPSEGGYSVQGPPMGILPVGWDEGTKDHTARGVPWAALVSARLGLTVGVTPRVTSVWPAHTACVRVGAVQWG